MSFTRFRSERGGFGLWILIMLPVLFIFLGISYDAGNMLAAHREADNIAASSARAAAQRVTESSLYSSAELGRVSIDADAAGEIVGQLGQAAGVEDVQLEFISVTSGATDAVKVTLTRPVSPVFLGLFGIGTVNIPGEATVRVRLAIEEDDYNVRCYDNDGDDC